MHSILSCDLHEYLFMDIYWSLSQLNLYTNVCVDLNNGCFKGLLICHVSVDACLTED